MDADRLKAFEHMLDEIQKDLDQKAFEMNKLKTQGKEKSVTFKQYLADKMFYQRVLSIYEKFGLL